jgi:glucose/arabinose dehydrogenase
MKSFPLATLVLPVLLATPCGAVTPQQLARIRLPEGGRIELFAQGVPHARHMALGPDGIVFVGTTEDKVYAVLDGKPTVVASGLNHPNGVAFRNGALYVAELNRLVRWKDIARRLSSPGAPEVLNSSFPDEIHHGYRVIRFGPDGKLYMGIGAPCNSCKPQFPLSATIVRMDADGQGLEIFARGVRNTVGFDWDPQTKDLWFSDHGRDYLGDNLPPDELNVAPRAGLDFGFPYCHAGDIADPELGKEKPCTAFTPPALKIPAHSAPLGVAFYQGRILFAEHGSWNRSKKDGYRIAEARKGKDGKLTYGVFAEGWLDPAVDKAWGRPVDLLPMPDGSLLVSDDEAGAIYRITSAKRKESR